VSNTPQVVIGCANRCGHTHEQPATRIAAEYSRNLPVGWLTISYKNLHGYWQESYVCSQACARFFLRTVIGEQESVVFNAN